MALNTFGWTPAEVTTDSAGNVISGVTLTVFTDVTKANQVTGLFDKDGTTPLPSGVVVSDNKGRFGFKASDAFSMLYVYDGSTADPWPIAAHEALDQGMASHAQAVADAQAAADSAAASAALVNAPADTAIKTAISNGATQSGAYLKTTFSGLAVNPVNVADKGAVGDGTTNDTAAVQAALSAGSVVEFQPGKTYLVDALTFAKTNGRIIGNGATIKLRTAAAAFLTIDAPGVSINGLIVDANNLASNWAVSVLAGRTDVRIVGSAIKNASGTSTTALVKVYGGCDGFILDGCHLSGVTTTAVGRGVLISDSTGTVAGVKIVNNLIENIQRQADGDGVVVQDFPGSVDVLIQGNTFRRCMKRSVKIMNPGVTVTGNTMDHTYNAGDGAAYAAVSAYASNTTITANRMSGVVTIAWVDLIPIAGAFTDLVVANNTMSTDLANRQSSADGISASPTSLTRATIVGNVIYGARHGVRLENTLRDIIAVGNVIHEMTGSAFIIKDATGNPDGVIIALNAIRTVANYYIHANGGNAPTSLVEYGNLGTAGFGYFGGNAGNGLVNTTTVPVSAAKTAGYTMTLTDDIVVMNAGAGTTLLLRDPTLVTKGRVYRAKNINAATLTVSSQGTSKTIDGAASMSLTQWQAARFVSDGTQWLTV